MLKLFSRNKKHQGTTEIDEQIKQQLKDVDDKIGNPMSKVSRASATVLQRLAVNWKDITAFCDVLIKLSSKDLSRDQQEGAYVLALAKFAELYKDTITQEQVYNQEVQEKFITPVNNIHRADIQEQTKALKKQYDKATQEYSGILSKTDTLHKDTKKMDILKLYAAEKERVRLKKIYEQSVYELKTHCEDLNEKVNFDFLEKLVDNIEAAKKCYGLIYGDLDEVKSYLEDLLKWCVEEKEIFGQHQQERAEQRTRYHQEERLQEIRQFMSEFDKETTEAIKKICLSSTSAPAQDIEPPLLDLFSQFGVSENNKQQADADPATLELHNNTSLDTLLNTVKNNFDAIGMDLLAKNKQDKLISLSESVAQLEKAS